MPKLHKTSLKHGVGENSQKHRVGRIVVTLVLFAGAVAMLYPLLWMLATSLRSAEEVYTAGPGLWVKEIHFENFITALTTFPFFTYMKNTVLIACCSVIFQVLSSALVGYGFARYSAPGSKPLFMLMLATMMLPGQVTMIPTFVLFKSLGWVNTLYPLFVPALFGGAFNIFLVRQFYMRVPESYAEAAKLDGCSEFQIWLKIYVPLAKPVLMTVGIFEFMGKWNDFMGPLIYINSDHYKTLALGLQSFISQYSTQSNLLMAASLVVILPCIILFFCFQEQFIKGISIGGEK